MNNDIIPVPERKPVLFTEIAKEVLAYAGIDTAFNEETLRMLGEAVCGWGHIPVRKTCPCEFGFHCNPEHPCGCSQGFSSRPCSRCCKGGSEKQQHFKAAYIVSKEAERDEQIAKNQRYVAALVRLRDCDWTISLPDRMDAVRDIAREALDGTGTKNETVDDEIKIMEEDLDRNDEKYGLY